MITTLQPPTQQEAPTATATDAMVTATGVTKSYDTGRVKVDALRGVDLTIGRGEIVSIMGPSGCGKTTLLNCLSGLDSITSGDILIEGTSLKSMSDRQRTRYRARRMGFVFQFYNLLAVLTAAENVEMPLLLTGVSTKEARERALAVLDLVNLREHANQRPAELSGGERQRVTIARALVNNPAIVWADEPTGDLDSRNALEIINLMCRLNEERGVTFALVTHDISIGRRAHRIVRMMDGRIVDEVIPA
jgi:putative ABC transport system ATP-binding protein